MKWTTLVALLVVLFLARNTEAAQMAGIIGGPPNSLTIVFDDGSAVTGSFSCGVGCGPQDTVWSWAPPTHLDMAPNDRIAVFLSGPCGFSFVTTQGYVGGTGGLNVFSVLGSGAEAILGGSGSQDCGGAVNATLLTESGRVLLLAGTQVRYLGQVPGLIGPTTTAGTTWGKLKLRFR